MSACKKIVTVTASSQLPGLNAYKGYCSNQLAAKALLDQKKQDKRVQDFLQRCLESPFSRKLDLWSFLDIPRSRLVKYPLLLREILRHTPPDHSDVSSLERAVCYSHYTQCCCLYLAVESDYYFTDYLVLCVLLNSTNNESFFNDPDHYNPGDSV